MRKIERIAKELEQAREGESNINSLVMRYVPFELRFNKKTERFDVIVDAELLLNANVMSVSQLLNNIGDRKIRMTAALVEKIRAELDEEFGEDK